MLGTCPKLSLPVPSSVANTRTFVSKLLTANIPAHVFCRNFVGVEFIANATTSAAVCQAPLDNHDVQR